MGLRSNAIESLKEQFFEAPFNREVLKVHIWDFEVMAYKAFRNNFSKLPLVVYIFQFDRVQCQEFSLFQDSIPNK